MSAGTPRKGRPRTSPSGGTTGLSCSPSATRAPVYRPPPRPGSSSASTAPVRGAAGGQGLGLAIVAAVAEAHDGTARCTAAPGGGALVTVVLPAAR
ncbi:ATP-binding protein [Streptomyces sp. SolWspMP-sol7th]|uniref:ATP-binding protein n=1 Tax=Streptomyces sp. SolWspMP-sol7th TaxID=1839776 RepID=UPI0034A0CA37